MFPLTYLLAYLLFGSLQWTSGSDPINNFALSAHIHLEKYSQRQNHKPLEYWPGDNSLAVNQGPELFVAILNLSGLGEVSAN